MVDVIEKPVREFGTTWLSGITIERQGDGRILVFAHREQAKLLIFEEKVCLNVSRHITGEGIHSRIEKALSFLAEDNAELSGIGDS